LTSIGTGLGFGPGAGQARDGQEPGPIIWRCGDKFKGPFREEEPDITGSGLNNQQNRDIHGQIRRRKSGKKTAGGDAEKSRILLLEYFVSSSDLEKRRSYGFFSCIVEFA
jgi:hypothetical protein